MICQNLVHKQTTLLAGWVRVVKEVDFFCFSASATFLCVVGASFSPSYSSPSPTSLKKSLPQAYIMSDSLSLSADFGPGSANAATLQVCPRSLSLRIVANFSFRNDCGQSW